MEGRDYCHHSFLAIMLFSSTIGQETGADCQPISAFLSGWDVVSVVTVWVWATALICVSVGLLDPYLLNQTGRQRNHVSVWTLQYWCLHVMSYTDNQQGKCMPGIFRIFNLICFRSPGPYFRLIDVKVRHRIDLELCGSQVSPSLPFFCDHVLLLLLRWDTGEVRTGLVVWLGLRVG